MNKIVASIDVNGAFGTQLDKPNVSTHFLITAIIVEKKDVRELADKTVIFVKNIFKLAKFIQETVSAKIKESFALKAESKRLLDEAKTMVDWKIEKGKHNK